MAQRNVEWYSVHTNSVALCEMAQRNVEWYSVHTNGVVLRRIALQNIRRSSSTLNYLALHEIFDVVANRRAFSWRDVKAISPKPPKIQTANGTAFYWEA